MAGRFFTTELQGRPLEPGHRFKSWVGGDEVTREEESRSNSAALGQGPGFASRDTRNNIFELFCKTKFSSSVVSDSVTAELQHARLPFPSPTSRACSNSYPQSWGCHPTISSSVVPFFFHLQSFPESRSLNESVLCIEWSKYWSFSFNISPSSEYSRLISFRTDWLDLLAVQRTLKSLLQHDSSEASIFQHSAFLIV